MKSLLIACHDAGGAELVASWFKHSSKKKSVQLNLSGPAEKVFNKYFDLQKMTIYDGKKIEEFDCLLTGTSWTSRFEVELLKQAKEKKVHCITFLDHWMDYSARFMLNGTQVLPNEIWVSDLHAYALAKKQFPDLLIKEVPNFFFLDSVRRIESAPKKADSTRYRILYVTEPTSEVGKKKTGNPNHYGYTEFEALEAYLNYLIKTKADKVSEVRVRTHPTEERQKYFSVIQKYSKQMPIEVSPNSDVIEDCIWCDWIVGCNSMVMALGVYAKKKVFCCIPNPGSEFLLPFPEIERLTY